MVRVLGVETGTVYGMFDDKQEAFRWLQETYPFYEKTPREKGRPSLKEKIYPERLLIAKHLN